MASLADRNSVDTDPLVAQTSALMSRVGIQLGGPRPWDVRVTGHEVYEHALAGDVLALGQDYVAGRWECPSVDELIARLATADLSSSLSSWWPAVRAKVGHWFSDGGSRVGARHVAEVHYDLPLQLYRAMLDRRMTYSCAYWAHAADLDAAQEAKLDLVCRKLGLRPGMRVLDIGCGWGSLIKFAAETYRVECVGITVSKEQAAYAEESCRGLPVEVRLQDYRDLSGRFDRIASIGMLEHVGAAHYRDFFRIAGEHLADDGLFLLHCIGSCQPAGTDNPWVGKFIFPGGHIPSFTELTQAIGDRFVLEDWQNIGADYDRTLMTWFQRFDAAWPELARLFEPAFYRRWKLYLLGCAGAFRARALQVWQLVLSPHGVPGGYISVR